MNHQNIAPQSGAFGEKGPIKKLSPGEYKAWNARVSVLSGAHNNLAQALSLYQPTFKTYEAPKATPVESAPQQLNYAETAPVAQQPEQSQSVAEEAIMPNKDPLLAARAAMDEAYENA